MQDSLDRAIRRYECVIFDFDGTLVDLNADWASLRVALHLRFPGIDFSKLSIGLLDVLEVYGEQEMSDAWRIVHQYELGGGWKLKPWTLDILAGCMERNQRIGIFTSNTRMTAEAILSSEGIRAKFQSVVGAESVRRRKPDPEGLFATLIKLNASMTQTIYVADGLYEAHTASMAGLSFFSIDHKTHHAIAA